MRSSKHHARRSSSNPDAKGNFFKRHVTFISVVFAVVVILIGIRLALPDVVKHYVNKELQKSPAYAGSVGSIGIELWRGAYQIRNISIYKRNGKIREPFFSAPYMDVSVQWRALFHHRLVTTIYMQQPRLNFVNGPTPQQKQAGEDTSWSQMLENLVPFKLNELEINDGEIHYQDDYSDPKVDLYFSELGASATNLSNAKQQKQALPAGIRANAKTIGGGSMTFRLELNPMAPQPVYQLDASLTNVYLPALNNFFRAYGKFDVAAGRFAMFTSVAATNAAYEGYIKVFFRNLDVFEWKKERHKNIVKIFWDAIVGTVADILKNQPHDQLATKIPISGVYTNSNVDLTSTIGALLRNAFIRALVPKYDEKVTTGEVTQSVKEGQIPNANTSGEGTNAPSATNSLNLPPAPLQTPAEKRHPGTLLETPERTNNAAHPP